MLTMLFNLIIVIVLLSCVSANLRSKELQDQIAHVEALTQAHLDAVKSYKHTVKREDFESEEDYLQVNEIMGSADSYRVHADETAATAVSSYIALNSFTDSKCSSLFITTTVIPLNTCLNSYSNGKATGSTKYIYSSTSGTNIKLKVTAYKKAGCTGSAYSSTYSFSSACSNYALYAYVNSPMTTTATGYYPYVYYDSSECSNLYGFSKYSTDCNAMSSTTSYKISCASSTKVSKRIIINVYMITYRHFYITNNKY